MVPNAMFALRKTEAAVGLSATDDAPVPTIGETDVLIRVAYAGLCGTDRHIYEWDQWSQGRITPPLTIGHEFSGTVVAVGKEVTSLRTGMRVSAEGHIGCRSCPNCRTGNSHVCERLEVIGIDRDGAFADYIAMPESNVWPLDASVPLRTAAVMDPLGNAMHTVMSADLAGKTVLVTGVGVIGLMAVAIARQAGAHDIIAIDITPSHLERAIAMGADHTIDSTKIEVKEEVLRLTGGHGVQVWLEMSGAPRAIDDGFASIASGATVAMLGLPKNQTPLHLAEDVILKGTTIKGISGRRMFETWYQMERFLRRPGNIDLVGGLITHELPIADFDEAFSVHASGSAIKVVMTVGGED